jgi:hypothetical protein
MVGVLTILNAWSLLTTIAVAFWAADLGYPCTIAEAAHERSLCFFEIKFVLQSDLITLPHLQPP